MIDNQYSCDSVQQLIALGNPLTQGQRSHLDTCTQCQIFQQEMLQIDQLVLKNIGNPVPTGFVDRVMSHVPMSTLNSGYEKLPGERYLQAIPRSGILQSLLLGLGIIVGLTQIVRFILSIFIISSLIAN